MRAPQPLLTTMLFSARLLRLIASAEHGVASGGTRVRAGDTEFEAVTGNILDLMAATARVTGRRVHHDRLYAVVEPVVGWQAAETIACLPQRLDPPAPGKTSSFPRYARRSPRPERKP